MLASLTARRLRPCREAYGLYALRFRVRSSEETVTSERVHNPTSMIIFILDIDSSDNHCARNPVLPTFGLKTSD